MRATCPAGARAANTALLDVLGLRSSKSNSAERRKLRPRSAAPCETVTRHRGTARDCGAAAPPSATAGEMSAFCMPMLIINMGGEMVYILEQRLHAQNVPMDKSKRGAH